MRKCILLLVCLSGVVQAYTPQDQATAYLKLDPSWHIVGQQNDPNTSIVAYFNGAVGSKGESLLETTVKKTADKSAVQQVQEMFNDMKVGIKQRGCEVGDLKEVAAPNDTFKKWHTSFQCKIPLQSGSMEIVDADATNLYTFTYNAKDENMQASEAAGAKLVSNSVQICYKGKSCYMA
jgi:hypothetical protein